MIIHVHVTPKSSRDEIVGWQTDQAGQRELAVRVTTAPESGKATKAACELIATALGLPKSAVRCTRGATSRHKQITVDGQEDLLDRLERS